jgi:hypothetical protein
VTQVIYDVEGAAMVEHDLLGFETRLLNPRPVLTRFIDILQHQMAERFDAEGEGDWEPLAASTVERKGSTTIGRETDAMMEALTTEDAEGALREVMDDELLFGINLTNEDGVPYPVIFNDGRAGQPARPLFDTGGLDLRAFTKALQEYIVEGDRSEFGVGSFGMGLTTPFGV